MKNIGAISETGPDVLGVIISCARNYVIFDDIIPDENYSIALFFTLFNVRIILALMRSALELKGLNFPADIERIKVIGIPDEFHHMMSVSENSTIGGRELYNWACENEKNICKLIDSFDVPNKHDMYGRNLQLLLYSLLLFNPQNLLVDNQRVADKILIMFDDVHKLSYRQRHSLLSQLFQFRPKTSVWIAERLEVLGMQDFFGSDGTVGREYDPPIYLETYASSIGKKFEKILISIADRRVRLSNSSRIASFSDCLKNELLFSDIKLAEVYENSVKIVKNRILEKTKNNSDYKEWISEREKFDGSPREKALSWKTLEIIINRDLNNAQMKLDLGIPYSYDELEEREYKSSNIKEAAEFYLAVEFGLPYYFGIDELTSLSSHNIEQFLYFAGELFEESISAELIRKDYALTPERQEKILKRSSSVRWNELSRRVPYGSNVVCFLENVCNYALKDLQKGTASYPSAGTITGIAISVMNKDDLIDSYNNPKNKAYSLLANVLSSCLTYNLLEMKDISQGGKKWTVLYLNRWICLHFGLPLKQGGWKSKTLNELYKWCNNKVSQDIDLNQISLY